MKHNQLIFSNQFDFQKYKATVQYVGTRYQGWQIQKRGPTIQGVLSEVLSKLAGEQVSLVGASRTDSGVHALGQVAHFFFPEKDSIPDLKRALNALLPWDIRIKNLKPVDQRFHAQKDARKKRYTYRIYVGNVLPPFLYNRCLHSPGLKGFEEMAIAAQHFEGTFDFSSFAASGTVVKSKVRTIYHSSLSRKGSTLTYQVESNGFLYHMIRNIVGTLIEVGSGKLNPDQILSIMEARNRTLAGPTAKAEGLVLTHIWY